MHLRFSSFAVLLVVVVGLTAGSASACEGCKYIQATSTGQSVVAVQSGFCWSVLFLLAVPFSLMAWLLQVITKACRVADQRSN